MCLPPQIVIVPALCVKGIKQNESEISYKKQESGEPLDAIDHFVTGERIPVTVLHAIKGTENRPILTPEERSELSTTQRLKSGETLRHIGFDNLSRRKSKKVATSWEKQELGKKLTILDCIRLGERPLVSCGKALTGTKRGPIPTPEERYEMSTLNRLKTGESGRHIVRQKKPTIRRKAKQNANNDQPVARSSI